MPLRLTRPTVGFSPTRPLTEAGQMMLPSVSVPTPTRRGWRRWRCRCRHWSRRDCGRARRRCCVWPPRELQPELERVERKLAHSLRLVLPRITAPAARSRATRKASLLRPVVGHRQRAGRVGHADCIDVVLEQHRDAMHRATNLAGLALGIECVGLLQRIGVELDDRVERGARLVQLARSGPGKPGSGHGRTVRPSRASCGHRLR